MRKNKLLFIFIILCFCTKIIKADELNYKPVFKDSFLFNNIHSIKFDDLNYDLYINETLATKIDLNHFSYTINQIKVDFVYNAETKNITVSYLKPVGYYLEIKTKIYSLNGKTILYINDGKNSREIIGSDLDTMIDFGDVTFYTSENRLITTNVYLDKTSNEVVFKADNNLNFKVKRNDDEVVQIILKGETATDDIYSINDPMNCSDAILGNIDETRINSYLNNKTVNLVNGAYNLSKVITLRNIMEKWIKISQTEYQKENVVVACTNKDKECEVYPKKAYLINDYEYQDVVIDLNNLIDGSANTPKQYRIYSDNYLYSETVPVIENVEVTKQERDIYKEYNNWSEYQNIACEETNDKKCRYKNFYTKYVYELVSSTKIYTDWQLQKEKLETPVETADTQYTDGPYSTCIKYDEKEVIRKESECLARDNELHKYLIHCQEDNNYEKFCIADTTTTKGQVYSLEPVNEADRDFCSKCTIERAYALKTDADGNRYSTFFLLGKARTVYVPIGNCTNIKSEEYREIVKGECLQRGMRYDLYKRVYLGDEDIYSSEPTIIKDQESCVEESTKEEIVKCEKELRSSYSYPDYRYSEWSDVLEFSNLENKEKRYKYRTYKTYGTKIENKTINKGEYTSQEIDSFINDIAFSKTRIESLDNNKEYYLLKENEKSEPFINNLLRNLSIIKNEKIFAPIIHVLNKEVSSLQTFTFENYNGSKTIGEYFVGSYTPIEEMIEKEEDAEIISKVVFFDTLNPEKLKKYDNWQDEEILLNEIANKSNAESAYELVLTRDDLLKLSTWRKNKEHNKNCELIKDFINVINKPENLKETILKRSGCE